MTNNAMELATEPEFIICWIPALGYMILLILFNFPLCVATTAVIIVCGIMFEKYNSNIAKLFYTIGIMVLITGVIIVINNWSNQLIIEIIGWG